MAIYKYYGTVNSQKFIDEFFWNNKLFYSYLITFNEYDGYFRIVRESKHEQALIGGVMLFNYSNEEDKISKYKIAGFKELNKLNKNN